VERTNPTVGTMAFTNGLGRFAVEKKRTITKYVSTAIRILRVMLVSHALSASTRLLRVFISLMSASMSERLGM